MQKTESPVRRKNSILLYGDYHAYILQLPVTERGKLLTALLAFAKDGSEEARVGKNPMTDLVYRVILSQAQRDKAKYEAVCERNKSIAKSRWEKREADEGSLSFDEENLNFSGEECEEVKDENASASDGLQKSQINRDFSASAVPKKSTKKYEKDKDKDNDKDNDNENDIRASAAKGGGSKGPPAGRGGYAQSFSKKPFYGKGKPPAHSENLSFDVDVFFEKALQSSYGTPDTGQTAEDTC